MLIDASALIAILTGEPEAAAYCELLGAAPAACIASVTALEAAMVATARVSGQGASGGDLIYRLIEQFDITVVAFTAADSRAALGAYERFGKGRHPAALNFGDCMVYAVAQRLSMPILCKGADFARTDARVISA